MASRQFHQGSLPQSEQQEPRAAEFKIVAEAFLELYELLEEYAPVWYTEQHHNRTMTAKRILERSREQRA